MTWTCERITTGATFIAVRVPRCSICFRCTEMDRKDQGSTYAQDG